jgi:hypothetical protein
MQAVLERRDDADVGSAAAHGPEQVGVLAGAGRAQSPVRCHDVDRQQIVAGEAVFAAQPAKAAAEREAGDAGGRDRTHRRGQAERLAVMVEFREREARLRARRAPRRVDAAALHR